MLDLLSSQHLTFLIIGIVVGFIVGVLPSFGVITALALLLPFVMNLDLASGLGVFLGVLIGVPTADSLTSILTGNMGSRSSEAITLDGFPLAKQGFAGRALAASYLASFLGGIVGIGCLILCLVVLEPLTQAIGQGELFIFMLFGIIIVGVLSEKNLFKGLCVCCFGLSTGFLNLEYSEQDPAFSLPILLVPLSLFTYPQLRNQLQNTTAIKVYKLGKGWRLGFKDIFQNATVWLRTSVLGSLLGFIPGLSNKVIDWISYGYTVQVSKVKDQFGKGNIRGLIGPDAANNAAESAALAPLLLFSIPESATSALILLLFASHEVELGSAIYDANFLIIIILFLVVGCFLSLFLIFLLSYPLSRLIRIPPRLSGLLMLVVVSFLVYRFEHSAVHLGLFLVLGEFALLLRRFGWSRDAYLVGFILAPFLGQYFEAALTEYSLLLFFRPSVILIMFLALMTIILARRGGVDDDFHLFSNFSVKRWSLLPHILFLIFLAGIFMWTIDRLPRHTTADSLPLLFAYSGLLFLGVVGVSFLIWKTKSSAFRDTHLNLISTRWRDLAWILAFFTAIILLGFEIATALLIIIFCRFRIRMGWLNLTLILVLTLTSLRALEVFCF